ncbi:hypothetical protein ACFQ4O_07495 [Methylopila musalis]|uniref:NACHT domain protein n=1 Tax=Methylopila musalis TaxID=1134781 RepID=A0ABW3Z6E3_9HYPH
MNAANEKHAKALQDALLALNPSGPDGFEGLLGLILGGITGQSFRLAKSGTQRGRDGDSAFDLGATYFEGKRYKDGLTKNDIAPKLLDLANDDDGQVDLWILGATCEVGSQTVEDARKFAANEGFGIAVLDWLNIDLGSLLIAVVSAGQRSKDFISSGLTGTPEAGLIAPALAAIDHFEQHPDFAQRFDSLSKALAEDVGLGHAKTNNQNWIDRLLKSKVEARAELGQPLAPLDPSGPVARDRAERAQLASAFSGTPEREVYAIVGEEGVGKSWLAAQGWSLSSPKSLLVICPADELIGSETEDFSEFLIRKLIRQTGGEITEKSIKRWKRRFNSWSKNLPASSVRITLIADGLNQPLKSNWGRWIDRAALHLKRLGGCLVLTTRTHHWTHLKNTVSCGVKQIILGEWSVDDVKQILARRSIVYSNIGNEVLESIRNPRLLGIAIELVEAGAIALLDELNVGRLLFEHMRRTDHHGGSPISGIAFAELLRELATKALQRANAQKKDDLRLFDTGEEEQLKAVSSSRFFSVVKGSTSKYEIKSEGLNLGLALYLVHQLEQELRNGRDPRDRLGTILEPISALDETAKVALLATQIACLDGETSPPVSSALIEKFVSLQNLPDAQVDAFANLATSAPIAFLAAAENVYLSAEHVPNDGWLLYALANHRDDPQVRRLIMESVKRWLSLYSLAPERRMHRSKQRDPAEQVEEERTKILAEIEKRKGELTNSEQIYLRENLVETPQAKFDALSRFAFHLVAGLPLAELAPHLVRWRFSFALNTSTSAPYTEFEQLLHYNCIDWEETRAALLKAIEALPELNSSRVGKWTRVGVLYGTGDPLDAEAGAELREELTRDQERFEGWSIKEDYCSVDPCDPGTKMPDNVSITARSYREIDPAKVATARGMGEQDYFFRGARAAVARFAPADAIVTHNALANNVLNRDGYARRQGVLELARHSAALTRDVADSFLAAGVASTASYRDEADGRDEFLTAQFSMLIAFPHLTAEEQFDAAADMKGGTLLLELLSCTKKANPAKVEQVLERVLQSGDEDAQTAVAAAIHYSGSELTSQAITIIKSFIRSTNENLRQEALALAASSGDTTLLRDVVDSGWGAKKSAGRDNKFENWHGSTAILRALDAGLIETDNALDRIDLSHYGFAAKRLTKECVDRVAARVEAALAKALAYEGNVALPDIATGIPKASDLTPPLISLTESPPPENDLASQMRRLAETDSQFDDRQRRMSEAYERFTAELTSADANLILSDLTFGGIKSIVEQDTARGERWLAMLAAASERELRHLHNFALQVAIARAANGNSAAVDLAARVLDQTPTVRRVSGAAAVPAESITLWHNADNLSLFEMCKKRLRMSQNDGDIAREVIAAHFAGKVALLQNYVDERLATGRPFEIALAIMIAGLSDQSAHSDAVLSRFEGTKGFIGAARSAAQDAYARNRWAKIWFRKMWDAQRGEDFWEASVLFMKVIDGRFDMWPKIPCEPSEIFRAFMPTIDKEINKQAEKRLGEHKKKLFGEKAPASLMLHAD